MKEKRSLLFLAVFVIIAGFFYSQRHVAFMIHDDMYYWMVTREGNLFARAREAALQGRFYHLYSFFVYAVPYLINSMIYIKAVSLISILFSVVCLFYISKKLLGPKVGLLIVVLFFTFAQIDMQHNAFVAYLFHHQVTIGILLLSIEKLIAYYREGKNKKILIISAVLYAIPVYLYESFLFYSILLFAISVYFHIKRDKKWFISIKKSLCDLKYHILLSVIYLGLYFGWSKLHPSVYEGSQWAFLGVKNFVATVVTLSTGLFPLNSFLHTIRGIRWSDFLNPFFLTKAVISSYLIMYLLKTIQLKISARFLCISGGFLILAIMLPSIPLALTSKYIEWVKEGTYGYVVSYFSYFFIIILMALLLIYVYQLGIKGMKFFLFCAFFIAAVCTDVNNVHWADVSQSDMDKRVMFNNVVSSSEFGEIPDESIIYIPDYIGMGASMDRTEQYVKMVSGKDIKMVNNEEEASLADDLYEIKYDKLSKTAMLYQRKGGTETAQRLLIFSLDEKEKGIVFRVDTQGDYLVKENGIGIGVFDGSAVVPIKFVDGKSTIECDSGICLEKMQVLVQKPEDFSLIRANFSKGFYAEESWGRWSQSESQMNIVNDSNREYSVRICLMAGTGYQEYSDFQMLSPDGKTTEFKLNNEYQQIQTEMIVKPGDNILKLKSGASQVDSGADPRTLYFKVSECLMEIVD